LENERRRKEFLTNAPRTVKQIEKELYKDLSNGLENPEDENQQPLFSQLVNRNYCR
jgi:hypothetical protein